MSSLWLALALLGTFAAVMTLGLALDYAQSSRRRAVDLLKGEVTPIDSPAVNLREEQLSTSFLERTAFPLAGRLGGLARRLTPPEMSARYARKLMLAGSPARWDAEKFAAIKVMGLVVGIPLGLWISGSIESRPLSLMFFGLVVAIGFFGPDAILDGRIRRRQEEISRALPDTLDLLTISVEAGLGFDAALNHVIHNVDGPLSLEISRSIHEMQLGVSRADALRNLAERSDVDELKGFVLSMVQADIFGISISRVLRVQASELRTKRRQKAEEKAMQIPVKILFPLIFCVVPSLFVVIIGPGAIRIYENFISKV